MKLKSLTTPPSKKNRVRRDASSDLCDTGKQLNIKRQGTFINPGESIHKSTQTFTDLALHVIHCNKCKKKYKKKLYDDDPTSLLFNLGKVQVVL